MTLAEFLYYLAGILAAAVSAGISGYFSLKHLDKTLENNNAKDKENRKLDQEMREAEDLNKILQSGLNCYFLDEFINRNDKLPVNFYYYLEDESDDDLKQLLRRILNRDPSFPELKKFTEFVHCTYAKRLDMDKFLYRYNVGTTRFVKIDIDKLNSDIDFVNNHLGTHYEKIKPKTN